MSVGGTEEEAAWSKERAGSQVLAALEFAAFQPISGRGDTDVDHIVAGRLVMRRPVCDLLL